jgi:methylamine--corrinoid protein Co-methyltransferase
MVSIWELYRRATTGPVVSEKDFLVKTLLPRTTELAKEYGVTRDPDEIIPTDPGLGKAVFNAALAYLEEKGLRCDDTSRVIKFTRKEIKERIRSMAGKMELGTGTERVTLRHREIGDKNPAINMPGPYGQDFSSEEEYLKVHQSYAQEPVDGIYSGCLICVKGRRVKVGTPDEYNATAVAARLLRDAVRRAGRPDMPINFECVAMTDKAYPAIAVPGGARRTDIWLGQPVYPCSTVKFETYNKVAFVVSHGLPFTGGSTAFLHGYSGGPETTAIVATADAIGALMVDGNYSSIVLNVEANRRSWIRKMTWCGNAARLALSNTPTIMRAGAGGGAFGYEMGFYRSVYSRLASEASAVGLIPSSSYGLYARWACEVGKAVTGMSLSDTNELMGILRKKFDFNEYEAKIASARTGTRSSLSKELFECYDRETLTPSKELLEMYHKARKELEDLGIPLQ